MPHEGGYGLDRESDLPVHDIGKRLRAAFVGDVTRLYLRRRIEQLGNQVRRGAPVPEVAKVYLPGFALSSARNSLAFAAGKDGWVTSA